MFPAVRCVLDLSFGLRKVVMDVSTTTTMERIPAIVLWYWKLANAKVPAIAAKITVGIPIHRWKFVQKLATAKWLFELCRQFS